MFILPTLASMFMAASALLTQAVLWYRYRPIPQFFAPGFRYLWQSLFGTGLCILHASQHCREYRVRTGGLVWAAWWSSPCTLSFFMMSWTHPRYGKSTPGVSGGLPFSVTYGRSFHIAALYVPHVFLVSVYLDCFMKKISSHT